MKWKESKDEGKIIRKKRNKKGQKERGKAKRRGKGGDYFLFPKFLFSPHP